MIKYTDIKADCSFYITISIALNKTENLLMIGISSPKLTTKVLKTETLKIIPIIVLESEVWFYQAVMFQITYQEQSGLSVNCLVRLGGY